MECSRVLIGEVLVETDSELSYIGSSSNASGPVKYQYFSFFLRFLSIPIGCVTSTIIYLFGSPFLFYLAHPPIGALAMSQTWESLCHVLQPDRHMHIFNLQPIML